MKKLKQRLNALKKKENFIKLYGDCLPLVTNL